MKITIALGQEKIPGCTPLLWYIKGNIPLKKEGISGDIPLIIGMTRSIIRVRFLFQIDFLKLK
mgnify:CR=1 FL=1